MHVTLAFSSLPLFLGAFLTDWAYARSYQVQWTNFASWLIAGGLLIAGLALLWAVVDVLRTSSTRHRSGMTYLLLLLAGIVVGFFNALIHARDGWAAMPSGLVLSGAVLVLVAAACIVGTNVLRRRVA